MPVPTPIRAKLCDAALCVSAGAYFKPLAALGADVQRIPARRRLSELNKHCIEKRAGL